MINHYKFEYIDINLRWKILVWITLEGSVVYGDLWERLSLRYPWIRSYLYLGVDHSKSY